MVTEIHDVEPTLALETDFDLCVASCGYETRSSYVCRRGARGKRLIAMTYDGEDGAFHSNRAAYLDHGWELMSADQGLSSLRQRLMLGPTQALIDISSMPRRVLAETIRTLFESPSEVNVRFAYFPADFEQTVKAAKRPESLTADAMTPFFAGAVRQPSIPLGLIVGLGLESDRAMGLIELLEPKSSWIFTTDSGDPRYRQETENVHRDLLSTFTLGQLYSYDIHSPALTYLAVESLCFSASSQFRLVLAPSGPKVFSLACLLVAAPRTSTRPAVWRIGSSGPRDAYDVRETTEVIACDVRFLPLAPRTPH